MKNCVLVNFTNVFKLNFLFVCLFFCLPIFIFPQTKNTKSENQKQKIDIPPKLVVGIVVDQMRYDYLWRYWKKFGRKWAQNFVSEVHAVVEHDAAGRYLEKKIS